jgi:DNA-binding transcriptional MerR regulator
METTATIGAVAGLAGVTVRALRRYDEIGLPVPAG